MLWELSTHQAPQGVCRARKHIVPIGRKGSHNVNQLASLSSFTCGRNCHLPQSCILYLNKPLSKHCSVSLLGHIWPAPWTGALRLAGRIPMEKPFYLFHGDRRHLEAPETMLGKDVDVTVDRVAAVIWGNHLTRVPWRSSHCQDLCTVSTACHTSSPSLSRLQEPSITLPPCVAHLFYHLYNPTRLYQSFSAEVARLLTHRLLTEHLTWGQHHPRGPQPPFITSWPQEQLTETGNTRVGDRRPGLHPASGKVIWLRRISAFLPASGHDHTCPIRLPPWSVVRVKRSDCERVLRVSAVDSIAREPNQMRL